MSDAKPAKLPPLPLVLTANDLLEGHVVYWTGEGWSPALADALVASERGAAEALVAVIPGTEPAVVEPYVVSVRLGADGKPATTHYRETIRVIGPTYEMAAPNLESAG